MLTIKNINILNTKLAGTPEWWIGEIFIGERSYIFQIHKRVGEWTIMGVKNKELTVKLARERVMGGYVMETSIIKQSCYCRSMCNVDGMRTPYLFTMCLDNHIKTVLK
jgi:hypothetical protein